MDYLINNSNPWIGCCGALVSAKLRCLVLLTIFLLFIFSCSQRRLYAHSTGNPVTACPHWLVSNPMKAHWRAELALSRTVLVASRIRRSRIDIIGREMSKCGAHIRRSSNRIRFPDNPELVRMPAYSIEPNDIDLCHYKSCLPWLTQLLSSVECKQRRSVPI